jgi:predicted transposase YdaD
MSKLIDFESNWEELEQSANVFALVVMAQLKAKRVKDGVARKDAKVAIIRLMYERGYSKQQILELFNVIDWMIQLPSSLNEDFLNTIYAIEEDKNMPYINTAEQVGLEKGRHEGELIGIKKGERIGVQRTQRETARNLISMNILTDAQIAQASGLSEAEVQALRSETTH